MLHLLFEFMANSKWLGLSFKMAFEEPHLAPQEQVKWNEPSWMNKYTSAWVVLFQQKQASQSVLNPKRMRRLI